MPTRNLGKRVGYDFSVQASSSGVFQAGATLVEPPLRTLTLVSAVSVAGPTRAAQTDRIAKSSLQNDGTQTPKPATAQPGVHSGCSLGDFLLSS
jgi:hypothetical protein